MSALAPETEEERAAFEADVKKIKTAVEAAFKKKCAALEAAFNRLPMPPPQENGIPYKEVIPGIARELALMGLAQKQRRAPTQKSLKKTAALMGNLVEAMDSLSPDTLMAWLTASDVRPEAFRRFKLMLRLLPLSVGTVEAVETSVATMGQPRKLGPQGVAERVAKYYCALTDRKPTVPTRDGTPYGPFLDLLTTVFKVLGVKASAASQGKDGLNGMGGRESAISNLVGQNGRPISFILQVPNMLSSAVEARGKPRRTPGGKHGRSFWPQRSAR